MIVMRLLLILLFTVAPTTNVWAAGEDLAGILQTLQTQLGPVYQLVVAIAYVMGIWFISDSIYRLKKYGQSRTMMSTQASLAKPVILMGIGVALLYFPTFATVSIQSLWVYGSSSSVLKYPSEPSMFDAFIHPLIDIIRLFGLIAVVRGLVILTKIANESTQPGTVGKGLMHIVAGTLAINIVGTIDVIKATFGFS
jgi:intracellular multiplication protein IcmC